MKPLKATKISLYCFGKSSNGEFGLGGIEEDNIFVPRKQKDGEINKQHFTIKQIAGGRDHTILLLIANTVIKGEPNNDQQQVKLTDSMMCFVSRVYSCGSNDRSQLGRDGSWRKFRLIEELNKHLVIQIASGYNHNLALTEAGQIFSWGCNLFGQLGMQLEGDDSLQTPTLIKKLGHEFIVQIACGGNHSLALNKSGLVYVWGSDAFGQLGIGQSGNFRISPVIVTNLISVPVTFIAAGGSHSMVISSANKLYVWGKNDFGQLGLGDLQQRNTPTLQSSHKSQCFCYIACGEDHSVALTKDGGLFTWGASMYGQTGHGRTANELLPRRVIELMGSEVTQVACGRCHTLAVLGAKGRLYSFGLNGCGQLGIGTQSSKTCPIKVDGPWMEVNIKDIAIRVESGPLIPRSHAEIEELLRAKFFVDKDNNHLKTIDEPRSESKDSVENDEVESTMDIDEIDNDFLVVDDNNQASSTSPRLSSPIIEEPEEMDVHNDKTKFKPIEIDEYISEPDSDYEDTNNYRHHFVRSSSLSGSVPGSLNRLHHVKLFAIIGSKGDQSFVLTSKYDDDLPIVDYRKMFSNITLFDNSMFENMLTLDADEKIPDDIVDYLETSFGSLTCWNGSYLSSELNHPRVDWEAAYYGFNCLRKCVNKRLTEIAFTALNEKVLVNLPLNLNDNRLDEEVLRVFLLLPLFHLFTNSKMNSKLHVSYANSVLRLNSDAKQILHNWLTAIDNYYFENLLNIYKECTLEVVKLIDESRRQENEQHQQPFTVNRKSHDSLKIYLDFLAYLHDINQKASKISYKKFYINQITDYVDIKLDYIYWLGEKSSRSKYSSPIGAPNKTFFCDYPFIFDAGAKTIVLSTDSAIRQQNAAENAIYRSLVLLPFANRSGGPQFIATDNPFFEITVNRNNIVCSAVNQLLSVNHSQDELKKPLKINFENEEAIDAGAGMKKEFFLLVMKELLDIKYGKFTEYNETHTIWFNAAETENSELKIYELIGLLCGLAIYNRVIIYLPFPLPLYKKLLNEQLVLEDLVYLDPYLVRSLNEIKNTSYTESEFNAVYGDLNFTIMLNCFNCPQEFELCENGKTKILKYDNRNEYVDLYWKFILTKSVEKQFNSFKIGFMKVVQSEMLDLFHSEELMQMVIGDDQYDWVQLEKEGTSYKPPFSPDHPTIKKFWSVFHSFDSEEKKNFLLFLTGSDRIPVLGMKALGVIIQPMKVSENHLPVAHTCFNVLDLPEEYSSEDILRTKLLQAIQHTKGFSLA